MDQTCGFGGENSIHWAFIAISNNGNIPSETDVTASINDTAIVSKCSIYAYWSPVSIYLELSTDSYIYTIYSSEAQSGIGLIEIDID